MKKINKKVIVNVIIRLIIGSISLIFLPVMGLLYIMWYIGDYMIRKFFESTL